MGAVDRFIRVASDVGARGRVNIGGGCAASERQRPEPVRVTVRLTALGHEARASGWTRFGTHAMEIAPERLIVLHRFSQRRRHIEPSRPRYQHPLDPQGPWSSWSCSTTASPTPV